ncbi:MAG: hypothetical protein U0R19_04215 [Bryobacteraceae bacterium]
MDRVEQIEAAINELPQAEFKRLIHWLHSLEESRWDEQMDRDCATGKLDFLIEEAERESRDGVLREWPVQD